MRTVSSLADTVRLTLARVAATRYIVEQGSEGATGETGLDDVPGALLAELATGAGPARRRSTESVHAHAPRGHRRL